MSSENRQIKRVVSGITASGKLTIGNYLGAIKRFTELQSQYESYIFVADLHALTTVTDGKILNENAKRTLALYFSCGINPKLTTVFRQSAVLAHGTMSWIMENQTTLGELMRMTQYKDKSKTQMESNGTTKITTGLLTYPALMAGDILLYDADFVPTGEDQKQHIELARDIAIRFNNRYGKIFVVPEPLIASTGAKIYSLTKPNAKMSKSDTDTKGTIYLLDKLEDAYAKIQRAVTDSENVVRQDKAKPGVTNLITIYSLLANIKAQEVEKKFLGSDYGKFKRDLGEIVKNLLLEIQTNYEKVLPEVDKITEINNQKAAIIATRKLSEVCRKIGLSTFFYK